MPEETENLHGEWEKDLQRFSSNPRLLELLVKYKEIFGALPPPSSACPLVKMDIELKEEWLGKPLRQKCWPMTNEDQNEIELQAQELVKAGLAEPYPPGEIPHFCSPTFLVDKKDSKTRRMVIQFRKLNARTKPHAGFLPNMDQLVESLAKCRFKSKLDMRSGFWQVGLTERARDLSAFCLPSGRILVFKELRGFSKSSLKFWPAKPSKTLRSAKFWSMAIWHHFSMTPVSVPKPLRSTSSFWRSTSRFANATKFELSCLSVLFSKPKRNIWAIPLVGVLGNRMKSVSKPFSIAKFITKRICNVFWVLSTSIGAMSRISLTLPPLLRTSSKSRLSGVGPPLSKKLLILLSKKLPTPNYLGSPDQKENL